MESYPLVIVSKLSRFKTFDELQNFGGYKKMAEGTYRLLVSTWLITLSDSDCATLESYGQ